MGIRLTTAAVMALALMAAGCGSDSYQSANEPESATVVAPTTSVASTKTLTMASESITSQDLNRPVVDEVALPSGGSPLPDVLGSVAADDGSGPSPLGSVAALPESVQVDFLFEFCWGPCFRDGHFMDPDNPGVGSGPFTSDTPFHVRHGFINNSGEPLGEGFDVVIYVTELDQPGEFGGHNMGETRRYTSDHVLQGISDQCGPTYGSQTGPETCEWFVHEFNDGLPEGRHALWAMWEAPCSAWVDDGFTDSCTDPDEVISLFSSGFDSPFGPFPPDYTEQNEAP